MSALRSIRIPLALVTAVTVLPAFACSFAPGYKVFQPKPIFRPEPALAPAPKVTVDRITRGHRGDAAATCSDAGILVLKVPSDVVGYSFEIVEGSFDDVVFPDGFVQPTEVGRLRFVWLDGNTNLQEPIRVVVKITTMSVDGNLSEPLLLKIEDPGSGGVR